MQKIQGVEKVQVSLNDDLTILELRRGNTIRLADLRTVIRNNGFVTRQADILARGRAITVEGRNLFEVAATAERFLLAGTPVARDTALDITGRVDFGNADLPTVTVSSSRGVAVDAAMIR
jgi:hypothetical protein